MIADVRCAGNWRRPGGMPGRTFLVQALFLSARASELLVSTDWLEKNLQDKNLRIIEVSVDPGQFERGHIPGAVGVPRGQAVAADGTFKSAGGSIALPVAPQ